MTSKLNANISTMPDYENWLRKDTWDLQDAVCLLINIEPLKRKRLILKGQKFHTIYSDILDTAGRAIGKNLVVEPKNRLLKRKNVRYRQKDGCFVSS